jgi:hypothetical protein
VGYVWAAIVVAKLAGIEPYEVMQALTGARRLPRLARGPGGIPVLTIWGRSRAGRRLIVAIRQLDDFDWQILGAREMTASEAAEYDRWEVQQ